MELTSIHGRKANNPHRASRTQIIPYKKSKKVFSNEDNFILEEEDENLENMKDDTYPATLLRQNTVIIGANSRIRTFSSIFSKLENIHERHLEIQCDSDSN